MLRISNFNLTLQDNPLIKNLSFTIDNGEVLTLMGPSGCGKSSLLNYLSGTLETGLVAEGEITLNQTRIDNLSTQERQVGILYQTPLLFPHMTNLENLLFAIDSKGQGLNKVQCKELAMSKLAELGLEVKANNLPTSLSGGQKARIALLRTLLSSPEYLLLDEPFSKLDPELRQSVRRFTLEQVKKANIPTLLVTHDEDDVAAMGSKLIQLNHLSHK